MICIIKKLHYRISKNKKFKNSSCSCNKVGGWKTAESILSAWCLAADGGAVAGVESMWVSGVPSEGVLHPDFYRCVCEREREKGQAAISFFAGFLGGGVMMCHGQIRSLTDPA